MAQGTGGSPPSNSVLHLHQNAGRIEAGWYHVNVKRDGNLKLRAIPTINLKVFDPVGWDELAPANPDVWTPQRLSELHIESEDLAIKFPEALCSVVRRIQQSVPIKPIPVTRLRRIYEWLRAAPQGLPSTELHFAIARRFQDSPRFLAEIYDESIRQFESYDNHTEPFIEGRPPLEFPLTANDRGTNAYVAALLQQNPAPHDVACPGYPFTLVARELAPKRSTAATGPWAFDDGRPSDTSGDGGIDLLMTNHDRRCPVVGEIKVGQDTTPFFGLLQALTYAAELSSRNQRMRLMSSFPEARFASFDECSTIEVCLLLHDCPTRMKPLLETTLEIARGLKKINAFSDRIRRIAVVESSVTMNPLELRLLDLI